MKAAILLGLLLHVAAIAAEEIKKSAVLFIPDQIERSESGGANLAGEVGVRWAEEEPLRLGLVSKTVTPGHDSVIGTIQVFDEEDRELKKIMYVTIPPVPDKEVVIASGESKRFGLWELYSTVIFPKRGNYYAIASFDGISGKKSVSFTTTKRWFKVVDGAPKRKIQ